MKIKGNQALVWVFPCTWFWQKGPRGSAYHASSGGVGGGAAAAVQVQGLVLAVMHEKALGSKSKWGPYLSFLPQDLSHMIIYWTVGASILCQQLSHHRAALKHDRPLWHKGCRPRVYSQLSDSYQVDGLACLLVQGHGHLLALSLGWVWHSLCWAAVMWAVCPGCPSGAAALSLQLLAGLLCDIAA